MATKITKRQIQTKRPYYPAGHTTEYQYRDFFKQKENYLKWKTGHARRKEKQLLKTDKYLVNPDEHCLETPGSSEVKTLPSNARGVGSVPGQGAL